MIKTVTRNGQTISPRMGEPLVKIGALSALLAGIACSAIWAQKYFFPFGKEVLPATDEVLSASKNLFNHVLVFGQLGVCMVFSCIFLRRQSRK